MPELSALDSLRWGGGDREKVSFYSPSLVLNTSRYPRSLVATHNTGLNTGS